MSVVVFSALFAALLFCKHADITSYRYNMIVQCRIVDGEVSEHTNHSALHWSRHHFQLNLYYTGQSKGCALQFTRNIYLHITCVQLPRLPCVEDGTHRQRTNPIPSTHL